MCCAHSDDINVLQSVCFKSRCCSRVLYRHEQLFLQLAGPLSCAARQHPESIFASEHQCTQYQQRLCSTVDKRNSRSLTLVTSGDLIDLLSVSTLFQHTAYTAYMRLVLAG
eukprot:jgi/Ulvmu1/11549/UM078_0040.1